MSKESCNRHNNCDEAAKEWFAKNPKENYLPPNFHCHDDECEDCFGQ